MPFMVMPDAISAIYLLMNTPKKNLSHDVYNITSFNPSPIEFHHLIRNYIHDINISYEINLKRQNMVDTWPSDIDDSLASKDWNWRPKYDLLKSFEKYLIPTLEKYYNIKVN